ncbi:MAG: metalloregulator ArsR/SmtB family transcription factor [Armatimonadetes bacterium]|nr:metalloregulator ArsR/SmtB family transcription factor [Armatimonadota bacterium]
MNALLLLAKALGDATRLRLLSLLRGGGELCVCELVDALEISQSTLSTHLQTLRQSGLVGARKDGKWMYYRLQSGQCALIETLFNFHREALQNDELLQNDAMRLEKRLALRCEGACVVGFGPRA